MFLWCGILSIGVLTVLKPAVVTTDGATRLLVLLRWQSGTIRFVNSVTGRPVAIHFKIGGMFQDFSMVTDETTEAYYTHGVYAMNTAASREATGTLRFCSQKGIALSVGFYYFLLEDDCMEIEMLWRI